MICWIVILGRRAAPFLSEYWMLPTQFMVPVIILTLFPALTVRKTGWFTMPKRALSMAGMTAPSLCSRLHGQKIIRPYLAHRSRLDLPRMCPLASRADSEFDFLWCGAR